MKRVLIALALTGCTGAVCGPGTHELDGVCLPDPPPAPVVEHAPPPPEILLPAAPSPALEALRVEVMLDGSMHVDGAPVSDEELAARIASYRGVLNDPAGASVHLVASPEVPHARLIEVMERVRQSGVTLVSIETSAPPAP